MDWSLKVSGIQLLFCGMTLVHKDWMKGSLQYHSTRCNKLNKLAQT